MESKQPQKHPKLPDILEISAKCVSEMSSANKAATGEATSSSDKERHIPASRKRRKIQHLLIFIYNRFTRTNFSESKNRTTTSPELLQKECEGRVEEVNQARNLTRPYEKALYAQYWIPCCCKTILNFSNKLLLLTANFLFCITPTSLPFSLLELVVDMQSDATVY